MDRTTLPLPYYTDDSVTIYHADCLEVLPILAGSCGLAIADPPYNVGIVYGESQPPDNRDNYEEWCAEWFSHLRMAAETVVLTPGTSSWSMWARLAGDPTWVIAWLKPNALSRTPIGFCKWEPVLVWGPSSTRATPDVIKAPIVLDPLADGHPCPKPLHLARRLVALNDGVVLDPFSGSGTALRAAKDLGRKAIGIEIEERFCKIAARRMGQEVLDLEAA